MESVVLFLVTCFWFPFPCYAASWSSTFPVCKSTTNPYSRGFICNILVASLSWGFAWITASHQGWPSTSGQVWILFLWSCLLVMHLKRNWATEQCQLPESGMRLAGDVRQLGLVISNNCFITVCINRNRCTVVIWRRRASGGHSGQACPEQGPRPELEFPCVCIPLAPLVSPRPWTRLFLIWSVHSVWGINRPLRCLC